MVLTGNQGVLQVRINMQAADNVHDEALIEHPADLELGVDTINSDSEDSAEYVIFWAYCHGAT